MQDWKKCYLVSFQIELEIGLYEYQRVWLWALTNSLIIWKCNNDFESVNEICWFRRSVTVHKRCDYMLEIFILNATMILHHLIMIFIWIRCWFTQKHVVHIHSKYWIVFSFKVLVYTKTLPFQELKYIYLANATLKYVLELWKNSNKVLPKYNWTIHR